VGVDERQAMLKTGVGDNILTGFCLNLRLNRGTLQGRRHDLMMANGKN
jgi:hypothetical protein